MTDSDLEFDHAQMAGVATTAAGPPPHAPAIDWSRAPAPVYANGVQMVFTPSEFGLTFLDGTPVGHDVATPPKVLPVASLRVSPVAYLDMVMTFVRGWNAFVAKHGDEASLPRFGVIPPSSEQPPSDPGSAQGAP